MGMTSRIRAFIPDTDETYQRHKKVLLVCLETNIGLPKETSEYFGCNYADESLLEEKLEISLKMGTHFEEYSADMTEGFEVDLTKLPQGVTKLRFENSY